MHTKHILDLAHHPFFPLLREHKLPLALMSDDPEMGGTSYKKQAKLLAGIGYAFPETLAPMSAEEFALCNLNAVEAAFCDAALKTELAGNIVRWLQENAVAVTHCVGMNMSAVSFGLLITYSMPHRLFGH